MLRRIDEIKAEGSVINIKITSDEDVKGSLYLLSDVHFDAVACDRDALKRSLDRALEEDAAIIIGGDWFDAMQGKFDPRRNLDELRPEYRCEKYFDVVVEDSAEFLKPYARNIIAVTQGNHELAVRKNSNTDLCDRLVFHLRLAGSRAVTGKWKGWFRFRFSVKGHYSSLKMYYAHSAAGANAPVTRGVIATNRQAVYEPDADIVWNGHTHTAYLVPIVRDRLSNKGRVYQDIGWYVRTPGYKRDWQEDDSFIAQKGFGPQPVGCAKVDIYAGYKGFPRVHMNLEIEA